MIKNFNEAEPYMEVFDGSKFTIDSVENNEYDIITIAHALGNLCRYGGHCTKFYSVAEHSVLMADAIYDKTGDKALAYECLMHDTAEAYMGDIPRPLKYKLPDYMAIIAKVESTIAKSFKFTFPTPKVIKEYDARMIKDEREQAMNPSENKWFHDGLESMGIRIMFLSPQHAKEDFIDAYHYYKPEGL